MQNPPTRVHTIPSCFNWYFVAFVGTIHAYFTLALLVDRPTSFGSHHNRRSQNVSNTSKLNRIRIIKQTPIMMSSPETTESLYEDERESFLVNSFEPRMIVFDKDGTLLDQAPALKHWVSVMTTKLVEELGNNGHDNGKIEQNVNTFHNAIGWDGINGCLKPSAPLAAGTWAEQIETCTALFGEMSIADAGEKIQSWHDGMGNIHGHDASVIDDLRGLMIQCKSEGLLVAIATSDERPATDMAIAKYNLKDVIDFSICADEVPNAKPNPDPLYYLCDQAGVTPLECIMVGDTTADTGMAKSAGAGLMVGVLTGAGTREQLLATGAHLTLPSVGQIPDLLRTLTLLKDQTQPISSPLSNGGYEDTISLPVKTPPPQA